MYHQAFYFYTDSVEKYDHLHPSPMVRPEHRAVKLIEVGDARDGLQDPVRYPIASAEQLASMHHGHRFEQFVQDADHETLVTVSSDAARLFARLHSPIPVKITPYLEQLHGKLVGMVSGLASELSIASSVDADHLYEQLQADLFRPGLREAGLSHLTGRLRSARLWYDPSQHCWGLDDEGQVSFGSPYEDISWFVKEYSLDQSVVRDEYQAQTGTLLDQEILRGFYGLFLLSELMEARDHGTDDGSESPDTTSTVERLVSLYHHNRQ